MMLMFSFDQYTPGTLLEVNARCTHAFKNQNIKGSISLEQHEDLKENSEYKGSSNRSKKRLDPRSLEQYTPGTVLEVDPSLTYGSENQNIKDGISLEQYEDIKENSEYKESSDRSKERFDPRSLEQYTPETVLEVDPRLTNASKNQNIKGSISLDEHEDLKENSEYKGSSDRSKERFDPRSLEQFAPGIVLGVDSRLTRASKNQNIKGSISLEQQKNLKQKLEFKGSSDRSKEHFDARHQGQHAPGSILERVTRLIRVWRNQKRKCCISLAQQEEVGKIPLNKVKTADSSTQAGSGSDTGSKDGVILEKRVPKKPSEPPVQQEEAKQKLGKSPLKDGEAAESSAQAGSGPDTDSKDGVPKTPAEPHVQKEEAKQNKKDLKPKSEFKGSSDRSKESFDKRYLGKYAPGSVLERVIRLLHAWKNQYRKGGISLGHHEEVGKSPLKEDETAELSTQGGSGSDTGCKVGVVLEKLVPKKPSEPPVQKEEAKQSKKEVGKSPLKEVETAEASVQVGSGSDTDSKVGVVLEKPVPKKPSNPLVQKEEAKQRKKDVKGELKLKGLSNGGQEGFSNSDQKQDKVTLETPSIPEKTASKKQVQSLSNKERMSERPESNRKSDSEMNSKESCKITWIEEEKKVKNNNLIDFVEKEKRKGRVTVLQTFSGQTEQDREYAVSHNLEMTFQENILLCSQNSTLQHKNDNEPEMESICKVNEEDVAYLSKNVKRAHINIYVNKMKEDRSFDIEMAGSLQRNIGNLEPHSGGLLQSSATGKHFTHSGDMKSTIQEKKPEIITARKCKEKTKHKETLFKNSHHNDSNSIDEPRCLEHSLPYRDKMSKNYLDAELNQHTQRLTIELEIMQTKFLTLEKEKISPQKQMKEERKMEILERKDGDKLTESRTSGKINKQFSMESHQNGKDEENKIPAEKSPMSISSKENLTPVHHVLKGHAKRTFNENNKDKGEMSADTLDDITQSCEIDTENSTKDSDYIWEKKKVLPIYEPVVKFTHSQWTRFRRKVNLLEKMIIGLREELSERMETKYQLKNRKAECDRKLYRSRLEGEKLQTQIHYPSCTSSAVLEHKSQTSKLNLQQQRDKWLFLKDNLIDKIDILSIQLSKVEDETYQVHNALRMKTLLLEQTQRQLKEFKDKLKQLKNENHIQKKKMNRLFFKEKALQEKLAQMQKKIQLLQKPFEDSQNKAVFISKGVQVQFKDSPMTFCTATAKKDPALEKRNKESVDDICVSLREKLRKLENENSKNKDTIRKLRKKLGDSQKKQLTTLQEILSHQTVLFLKQKLQEKVDETTHKLQKSQEEDKQKLKYLKERKDYIQKLKMERATFEDAIKQQMDKTEKLPKQFLEFLIKYDAELQQQLDAVSSTNRHVESINRHLQEETIENLKQKYDRLDLMHHLEIPMDQIQYGPKIKEKVKKKFNPLLKIQQLKAKFHKRNIVHQELKAELERYRKLFSQEYRFTTGPFLEPMNNEFVDTSVVLPRRRSIDTSVVLPRRRSINFTENTESSENSTEDCFSTIQQAKENSVAKSDDDISELPSTSRWASPIGYTRRPNLNWDPVSRPT
ncbi:uncharacterized protein LOC141543985 [Sminthopsis crassicaudata]|uniref:uncharacterized protein LOC141543985 n=1 Tax=Sminthopsis crassicaudata TaxID=9301 RepID=UPI003D68C71D